MCPPCLNFFNWPVLSPLPALSSHLEKSNPGWGYRKKKKIALTPLFFVQICLEPPTPTAPHGKNMKLDLTPQPLSLTLPARK